LLQLVYEINKKDFSPRSKIYYTHTNTRDNPKAGVYKRKANSEFVFILHFKQHRYSIAYFLFIYFVFLYLVMFVVAKEEMMDNPLGTNHRSICIIREIGSATQTDLTTWIETAHAYALLCLYQ